jgi:hypothetical protein
MAVDIVGAIWHLYSPCAREARKGDAARMLLTNQSKKPVISARLPL